MSETSLSDVKIKFDGIELVPFCVSQSLKEAKTTFSTLSQKLPVRIKSPLIVTTELFGEKSVQILQPIDPSYNLLK